MSQQLPASLSCVSRATDPRPDWLPKASAHGAQLVGKPQRLPAWQGMSFHPDMGAFYLYLPMHTTDHEVLAVTSCGHGICSH